MNKLRAAAAMACALLMPWSAGAQTAPADIGDLSLQQLLEVETVSTASKFPQQVTQAPASITIVTGEDIRRYGHRTLSDVLRSVRGLYTSYDRNYSYLGVRGFGRPGDYNTRILLLIDGHRLNDPAYDMGPIGTDLPLDVESIDRVEVIRGPGSALYGSNAFFAVINVITRTGRQDAGIHTQAEAGTLGTRRVRGSAGHVFGNGTNLVISASRHAIDGADSVYFPEYDAPETAHGIARQSDRDRGERVFAAVSLGGVTIRAAYADRTKQVPTASFGTVFGDNRLETDDTYAIADVNYTGALGGGWTGIARGAYDRYHYDGRYPVDYGAGAQLFTGSSRSDWVSAELTASRRIAARHFLTIGGDARYAFRQELTTSDLNGIVPIDSRRFGSWGVYGQHEWSVTKTLALSGGLRLDRAASWGSTVTPRVAAVYSPGAGTALKAMHGRAFRAPNAYELYFYIPGMQLLASDLVPERVRTTELAWEQYYGRRFRSTVAVFHSDIEDLVTQMPVEGDMWMFANVAAARSTGIEAEVEARWPGGLVARASHAVTRAREDESAERPSNSPAHVAKAAVIVPLGASWAFLGLESAYTSARRSVQQTDLDGFFLQNLTLTADRLIPGADLQFSIHNVLNQHFSDPGAEEHRQAGIPQDGRTVRVRVGFRF